MLLSNRPRLRGSPSNRESGAAAVEFALIAPVFFMVVFGIMSFGIVFAQQLALGNAARQVARLGVVTGQTCSGLVAQKNAAASTIAMQGSKVTMTVARLSGATPPAADTPVCGSTWPAADAPCKGSANGDSLKVTLKYQSNLIIPLAVVNPTFNLSGIGVFKCETS